MALAAQNNMVVTKHDVHKCKFCGADICWQVGRMSGKKYPTNVYVAYGQIVTQHTNFHSCTQAQRDAYQKSQLEKAGQASFITGAPVMAPKLDMTGVNALFDKASASGLKWPKIRLITPAGQNVALGRAGDRSKYKGQVMVTDGGPFGSNVYFGRVDQAGEYHPTDQSTPEIRSLLEQLGADPAKVASAYGKLTGNCCFCHRSLFGEDQRSTDVGYGPVCARKFGLPW
jgi:hypothetical protein